MNIVGSIQRWLHGDDLDEDAPRSKKGKKPSSGSLLSRPRRSVPSETIPWWAVKPDATSRADSIRLEGDDAALAKRVTMRIHTDRFLCPPLQPWHNLLLRMVVKKTLTVESLAKLFAHHPEIPARGLLATHGVELAEAPRGEEAWNEALAHVKPELLSRSLLEMTALYVIEKAIGQECEESADMQDHAQAAGVAALHLGQTFHLKRADLAHLTALLHDIGRAVVLGTILRETQDNHEPTERVIHMLLDTLHEEAGLHVARHWGLPDAMTQVIGNHHGQLDKDDRLAGLRALVQLADEAAMRCGHGGGELPRDGSPLVETASARFLGIRTANAEMILGPLPTLVVEAMI